jgi:hypothetical protein
MGVSVHSGHAPLTAAEVSILCANRDEFLGRPTLPAHFHSFEALSQPGSVYLSLTLMNLAVQQAQGTPPADSVLSGRDVLAGGCLARYPPDPLDASHSCECSICCSPSFHPCIKAQEAPLLHPILPSTCIPM